MEKEREAASALKLEGNKAFSKHDWPTALDFYTKAIEKYDQDPSFFSNRAQVCLTYRSSAKADAFQQRAECRRMVRLTSS